LPGKSLIFPDFQNFPIQFPISGGNSNFTALICLKELSIFKMDQLESFSFNHFAAVLVTITVSCCGFHHAMAQTGDGFKQYSEQKVKLGQLLFFDKILSGNKNISCASCHHPLNHTADGLPLGIGEGGRGTGPSRALEGVAQGDFNIKKRIPRNAPALFNLGHREFRVMFHDGRVQSNTRHSSGFETPAKDETPHGLESPLAAQALFPPTSAEEMAGEPGSNEIADAAAAKKFSTIWEILTGRIRGIPEYVNLFQRAYPDQITTAETVTIIHIVNAIAAFESTAWRADNSPFDRFMNGDMEGISKEARTGMTLFLGKAQCTRCHSGKFQTDHNFHAIAMPQIGPGKGDGTNGMHDFGRERVTGRETDRCKFRTPSLRNVALTAPYGHSGAYPDLKTTILHHTNPAYAVANFDSTTVRMPQTFTLTTADAAVMQDPNMVKDLIKQSEITKIDLSDEEINQLIEFLHCLTDPKSINLLQDVPHRVPSGLSLID